MIRFDVIYILLLSLLTLGINSLKYFVKMCSNIIGVQLQIQEPSIGNKLLRKQDNY